MPQFRFHQFALRCSLALLCLGGLLPSQALAQEKQAQSAVEKHPVAAMIALQVLLETFAVDHQRYPASLFELHQAARRGGYGLETVTSKDKETGLSRAVLPEISSQLYLDTQAQLSLMPPRHLRYLWQVQNGKFNPYWQDYTSRGWRQDGAVFYVPIYPQDPNAAIRTYAIVAVNPDGSMHRQKGQLFYLSNGDSLRLTPFEQTQWNALERLKHWPEDPKTTYNAAESSSPKL